MVNNSKKTLPESLMSANVGWVIAGVPSISKTCDIEVAVNSALTKKTLAKSVLFKKCFISGSITGRNLLLGGASRRGGMGGEG